MPSRHNVNSVAFALLVAVLVAACSSGPAASFDPSAPCSADGAAPGAYPDLEARIPTTYEGQPPSHLDSGRHCDSESLGSLAAAGITEVRFAGGTWDLGGDAAVALVVFQADVLTADQVAEFYATSARASNRTTIVHETVLTVAGRSGRRLDTMTGDRSQTIVIWPGADPGVVNVVISNELPDPKIQDAVDAFGGR